MQGQAWHPEEGWDSTGYRDAEWENICSGGALERPVASGMVTDLSRGIGQGKHGLGLSEGRRPEVGQRNWGLDVRLLLGVRACGGDAW